MSTIAGVFVAFEQDRPLLLQREECCLDRVVKRAWRAEEAREFEFLGRIRREYPFVRIPDLVLLRQNHNNLPPIFFAD